MITRIENTPRNYAWGSKTLLVDLGYKETGSPLAEVWFGTHPLCESVAQPSGRPLSNELGHSLHFMIKFLAAAKPLSIQVHPNESQAQAGFDAENIQGLAIDDSSRNYKDASAKREAIVAVSEFELLAGLKPIEEIRSMLSELARRLSGIGGQLATGYLHVAEEASDAETLLREIFKSTEVTEEQLDLLGQLQRSMHEIDESIIDTKLLADLFENFGFDRGILVALFMRRFKLQPGQAVFVDAGVPHSYLRGLGVEILNSSDNVLRGGLTDKHVSPEDFISVLDAPGSVSVNAQSGTQVSNGLWEYRLENVDFSLHRISVSGQNLLADLKLPGESILVCTAGELDVSNSLGDFVKIRRGEAAFLSNDANFFTVAGSGEGYLGSSLN